MPQKTRPGTRCPACGIVVLGHLLLSCDLEGVEVVDPDVVIQDVPLPCRWNDFPHVLRCFEITLDDEHAALLQPEHGIGVAEYVGVWRQSRIHMMVLAIDSGLAPGQRTSNRWLVALSSQIRIRIGLMLCPSRSKRVIARFFPVVIAPQAAYRVYAHCDRAFGRRSGFSLPLTARSLMYGYPSWIFCWKISCFGVNALSCRKLIDK